MGNCQSGNERGTPPGILHAIQLLRTFCAQDTTNRNTEKEKKQRRDDSISIRASPPSLLSLFSAPPVGPFRRYVHCCGCVSSLSFARLAFHSPPFPLPLLSLCHRRGGGEERKNHFSPPPHPAPFPLANLQYDSIKVASSPRGMQKNHKYCTVLKIAQDSALYNISQL